MSVGNLLAGLLIGMLPSVLGMKPSVLLLTIGYAVGLSLIHICSAARPDMNVRLKRARELAGYAVQLTKDEGLPTDYPHS